MAKIVIDDDIPELPEEEVKKRRDFMRVQHRFQQVSHGLRKRRLNKIKNRYWFLAVLVILLLLVFILT